LVGVAVWVASVVAVASGIVVGVAVSVVPGPSDPRSSAGVGVAVLAGASVRTTSCWPAGNESVAVPSSATVVAASRVPSLASVAVRRRPGSSASSSRTTVAVAGASYVRSGPVAARE
jgi:hypothetical protein